ncbi:unnamed protein product [Closterium sp. NIES-65]|nr:unnamed protein product [Closterium sp. NIES-65]
MCSTSRWLNPLNPPQPAPIRATVHSESPLRPCLRVFEGINGVATISSLKSQAGKDSVSYSLVISGTASPPIHSSLVIGNPLTSGIWSLGGGQLADKGGHWDMD